MVCDQAFRVVAVVECDDASHDGEKDRRRDEIVREAGAPTIRWRARKLPNREEILKAILAS